MAQASLPAAPCEARVFLEPSPCGRREEVVILSEANGSLNISCLLPRRNDQRCFAALNMTGEEMTISAEVTGYLESCGKLNSAFAQRSGYSTDIKLPTDVPQP